VFFTAEFSSPWALDSPNPELLATIVMPEADHVSLFHILVEGQCLLDCDSYPRVAMESGDVVVFPHGHAHTMRSEDRAESTPLDHVLSRPSPDALPKVSLGGGGRRTRFICGYLNCNQRFAPLFEALPSLLIVRRRTDYGTVEAIDRTPREIADVPQESGTWLATTLNFTVNEAFAARPGNAAMLGRLTELMFVEIVREYMQRLNRREGDCSRPSKTPMSVKRFGSFMSGRCDRGPWTCWLMTWGSRDPAWRSGSRACSAHRR
jgi:hypothetical protein